MNDNYIFEENGKMYICVKALYTSNGFKAPEVWKECSYIPEILKKSTVPHGTSVIVNYKGTKYMLWNTSGKAFGKWFTYFCDGLRFELPEKIPSGVNEGYKFILNKYQDRKIQIKKQKRNNESFIRLKIVYSPLKHTDYTVKSNKMLESMKHYNKMREYFSLDIYNKICFGCLIYETDSIYQKYCEKDISIEDVLFDNINGNWTYSGGIGEIIFLGE